MIKFAFLFLALFLISSCKNNKPDVVKDVDIFNISYTDYRTVKGLEAYKKVSDTAFLNFGNDNTHRITHLMRNDQTLILFSKIERNEDYSENYRLLDTLQLTSLPQDQQITIGYCEQDGAMMDQLIAIVYKSDADTIKKVENLWKANGETSKIEPLEVNDAIFCINEFYPF